MADTIVLYHYTDKESAKKIKDSQMIKQSSGDGNRDVTFGQGVYLTSIAPTASEEAIAQNNFDDSPAGVKRKIDAGKIKNVVTITFKTDDPKLNKEKSRRNVYRYKGDLHLKDYKYTIGPR